MEVEGDSKAVSTTIMIRLDKGEPDATVIPFDLLSDASRQVFNGEVNNKKQTIWTYGEKGGSSELRHHLIDFICHTCSITTLSFENVCITGGISAILDQICTMFLQPGDTMLVECPTYMYALDIFRDHHLHIVSCETDDDGLILEPTFVTEVIEKTKPKMIYIVPTFQNPAGFTMSHHRREQLVQLSVQYKFLIVADEVYHFLNYQQVEKNNLLVENPKLFAAYHATGTVISLYSFSKILTPGLRLGFACASRENIEAIAQYGMTRSGGVASPLTSSMVDWIVVNGLLNKFIDETLCVEFSKRMRVMHNALIQAFGNNMITCRLPSGGYFLWVKFNDTTVDCDQLLVFAQKHGVGFKPGRMFAHDENAKA
ncbi:unnamed protein product, partial [Rotaria sp. Silwood1]